MQPCVESRCLVNLLNNTMFIPTRSNNGSDQLLAGANGIFGREKKSSSDEAPIDVKTLHAKIGELTLENDFLEGALTKAGLLSVKR